MKNLICFLKAFLVSVLMFVSAGFFIRLNTGLMQPLIPAKFFMIALQSVCALKFALIVIMLMPNKPALKQLGWGFVLADGVIMFSGMVINDGLTLPVALFVVQAMLMVYYMAGQGRLWIYKSTATSTNRKLVTSAI